MIYAATFLIVFVAGFLVINRVLEGVRFHRIFEDRRKDM